LGAICKSILDLHKNPLNYFTYIYIFFVITNEKFLKWKSEHYAANHFFRVFSKRKSKNKKTPQENLVYFSKIKNEI
jgi:hypothetical protein